MNVEYIRHLEIAEPAEPTEPVELAEPAEPTETREIYEIHAWKIIRFFKVFCQLIRWPIVWNWLLYYKIKTNVNTQTNISPVIGYFEKFLAALERD